MVSIQFGAAMCEREEERRGEERSAGKLILVTDLCKFLLQAVDLLEVFQAKCLKGVEQVVEEDRRPLAAELLFLPYLSPHTPMAGGRSYHELEVGHKLETSLHVPAARLACKGQNDLPHNPRRISSPPDRHSHGVRSLVDLELSPEQLHKDLLVEVPAVHSENDVFLLDPSQVCGTSRHHPFQLAA
eukprot:763048-Hanusia_phi.AAC.2